MAVYAIGDVQGCFDELTALLKQIHFNPDHDQLWFAGDLVNRGPKSLETLRFVRDLGDGAVTVLGNHDLHLLAADHNPEYAKKKDTLEAILEAPDRQELLDWLRHRPLLHHDATLGYTMLHAGLPPDWDLERAQTLAHEVETLLRGKNVGAYFDHMYGDQPNQWADNLIGWDRTRFITNCFTRMRFCDNEGRLALQYKGPPGTQPRSFQPWFNIPNRASQDLKLVFGHWSTLGKQNTANIFPLDTGCLWGGALTALQLEENPKWHHLACPGAAKPPKI